MAVYHLTVRYGDWDVVVHSERGYAEWALIGRATSPQRSRDDRRPIGLAVLAWARSHDVPFRLDAPDDFNHDLAAHGADTLDWLSAGNAPALERCYRVWIEDWRIAADPRAGAAYPQHAVEAVTRLEQAAGHVREERGDEDHDRSQDHA